MEKMSLTLLLKDYNVRNIERHLVWHYLLVNSIDLEKSNYLRDYFIDFKYDPLLASKVSLIGHNNLEMLVADMELLIPSVDRKLNGAFFTPSYIVDYIISALNPDFSATFIDISCGCGAFLLGVARFLHTHYKKPVSDCIKENIYGIDLLGYNVNRAKLLLILYALENGEVIEADSINVICDDTLRHNFSDLFDYVIGNPPYVKFQDMEDETRAFLAKNFETTQFGTYNLYFAFFEIGLNILKPNGCLGYITPNNYFTSLAGECLRRFFQKTKSIYQIVDFNATRIFEVQTYTSITFLSRKCNSFIGYSRIANAQDPQLFLKGIKFTANSYNSLSEKKWRLLCGNERQNISSIESIGEPIGQLFNICVGIATLKDEVYFLDPESEDNQFYYFKKKGENFKVEKEVTRPLIKISDMKKQSDVNANRRKIIFPYRIVNGKATSISEEDLSLAYPECYKYFLAAKEILQSRGKGKHEYSPFYAYGRTQGLNRTGIKLLTPTFSKKPRFLFDDCINGFFTNGYGVYLESKPLSLFSYDHMQTVSAENLDVIQKILNSFVMEYYVDKTSVAIQGGYPCYQKNFIERFCIPDLSNDEISSLRKMTQKEDIDLFLISKYHLNVSYPNLS